MSTNYARWRIISFTVAEARLDNPYRRTSVAKITKSASTELYGLMQQSASAINESLDCAVKAVAAACSVPYLEAHQALKAAGRKDRRRTPTHMILDTIVKLGFHWQRMNLSHFIDRYPGGWKNFKNVTTHHPARFPNVWKDGAIYLMFTRGHVLTIIDGQVHDWSINNAKRATKIYRITK